MAARTLDKSKPYDTVHGSGRIKYFQFGRHFDAKGSHIKELDAKRVDPVQKKRIEARMADPEPEAPRIVRKLSMYQEPEPNADASKENVRADAVEERYAE